MAGNGAGSREENRSDPHGVLEISTRAGALLRATCAARARDGFTAEELLIYLAIGHLGIDAGGAIPRLRPRTFLEIAEFLAIPRETVRRKVGRLCDRGYAQLGPGGVVVRDLEVWLRHATAVAGMGAVAGDETGGRGLPRTVAKM